MKVFRTKKFIEHCIKLGAIDIIECIILGANWCVRLEGKTKEEIIELGYRYSEEWLVEE